MAKSKKKNGHRKADSIITTLEKLVSAGIALGGVWNAIQVGMNRGLDAGASRFISNYSGYDMSLGSYRGRNDFQAERLSRGYVPLAGGYVHSKWTGLVRKHAPISRRNSFLSNLTSVITRALANISPIIAAKTAIDRGWGIDAWANNTAAEFTGIESSMFGGRTNFDPMRLIRGYGPGAGGIIFKKGVSYATKNLRLKSVFGA